MQVQVLSPVFLKKRLKLKQSVENAWVIAVFILQKIKEILYEQMGFDKNLVKILSKDCIQYKPNL